MLIKNVGIITVLFVPLGLALLVGAANPAHLRQLLDTDRSCLENNNACYG